MLTRPEPPHYRAELATCAAPRGIARGSSRSSTVARPIALRRPRAPVRPSATVTTLAEQLAKLPSNLRAELARTGFDPKRLETWAATLGATTADRNRVQGEVAPPEPGDVTAAPEPGSPEAERFAERGLAAIARGELALVVLAGGMATRMGGVVKALVEAAGGQTFLELRLAEHDRWSERSGSIVPLWLMTSYATDEPIRRALGPRLGGDAIATFVQGASLRLARDGSLFLDANGSPSVYATGHGDLPEALAASGLLERFRARGGRYVWIANLDNLGAGIDPVLLGWHIAHGAPLSVEVVSKVGSDRGGIPVRWNGRPVVLEELRLPTGFDAAQVRVFNTNTFLVDARALAELRMDFTWLEVEKKVDGRPAVQFERLVGEMTTVLDTRFVRVPRDGVRSRFLPVKDPAELETRRAEIAAVARDRGMLG